MTKSTKATEKYLKARKLVETGETIRNACKAVGISSATYSRRQKEGVNNTPTVVVHNVEAKPRKSYTRSKPSTKDFCIVTTTSNLLNVIEALNR